ALAPRDIADAARERVALAVARDVGEALESLHALGVAHGDVKPDNVVVDAGASVTRATLVDLGLAASTEEATPRGGTVRYLAPEVTRPEGGGDARARDLFALGLVLAEIASRSVAESDRPAELARGTAVPGGLARVVRALLSEAPAARPSAAWVAARARQLLPGTGSPERLGE